MKLDARTLARAALPVGKGDAIFFDDDLPGFGLRLRTSGDGQVRQTWIAQYRSHGRTRRMKIGDAKKVSPEEARRAAKKVLAKVELGNDPQHEKAQERLKQAHTLRSVIDRYLEDAKPRLRPSSFRSINLHLTGRDYFGPLHSTPVTEVTLADVAARLGTIKRANGSTTAARARGALSAVYSWAAGEGLLGKHPVNPVAWTNKPQASRPRERTLSDSELAAVWRACGDDDEGRVTRLLILTGQRRGEVGGMTWSELNLERGTWTIAAARSKNGRSHTVPLPTLAVELIRQMAQIVGRDQLFGQFSGAGFTGWARAKATLDARVGDQVAAWHVHDLRRSFATRLCDLGVAPHVVEQLLNHVSGHRRGIVSVYNKSVYERETRNAMAVWSDHVRTLVEGGERKVLAFPQDSA